MIDRIVNDVCAAIRAEAYLAALSLALTLPDICGKALYPDKKTTERYKAWYDEYLGKYENPNSDQDEIKTPYLSADVVYSLRCSLLHQGTADLDDSKIKQAENQKIDDFSLFADNPMSAGCSETEWIFINGEYQKTHVSWDVNVKNLCCKLCQGAKVCYKENKEKFDFFTYHLNF